MKDNIKTIVKLSSTMMGIINILYQACYIFNAIMPIDKT